MALVIEDGTVVAGANSFVTVAEIRAFATARGITLPAEDPAVEVFAVKAMDFLIAAEPRMIGRRTDPANQELPYPRTGVVIYSAELLPDGIPSALKQGQMQLAVDVAQGVPLFPDDTADPATKREKVGQIETEYFGPSTAATGGALAAAWGFLAPLFRGQGFGLTTVRV